MNERKELVTIHGNPLTLLGTELKVGDQFPDVVLLNNDLKPVKVADYLGKTVILSAVPSLDTPVCDTETRRFNQEAIHLGGEVVVLTVSMDLPFAQKRWCGAAGVERVVTLSDHKEASLGLEAGILIKELRLLARSVFVLDGEGILRFVQLVKEVGSEPDYDAVLKAVAEVRGAGG